MEIIRQSLVFTLMVYCTNYVYGITEQDLEYGLNIFLRAYDLTCWYESGIKFPNPNANRYRQCVGTMKYVKQTLAEFDKGHTMDFKTKWFGEYFVGPNGPLQLNSEYYITNCKNFGLNPMAKATADESKLLEDKSADFPFKALSHCLVSTMRRQGGERAIDTLTSNKVKKEKPWREMVLDRHNFLRSVHNSPPLTLSEELNKNAQAWVEKIVAGCQPVHASCQELLAGDNPQGENVGATILIDDLGLIGMQVTNSYYEEIKDYCYPDEFVSYSESKPPGCVLSGWGQTGHFTQMIWKTVKELGVGVACNAKCDWELCMAVMRYGPPGNHIGMPNAFKQNVERPKQ